MILIRSIIGVWLWVKKKSADKHNDKNQYSFYFRCEIVYGFDAFPFIRTLILRIYYRKYVENKQNSIYPLFNLVKQLNDIASTFALD